MFYSSAQGRVDTRLHSWSVNPEWTVTIKFKLRLKIFRCTKLCGLSHFCMKKPLPNGSSSVLLLICTL